MNFLWEFSITWSQGYVFACTQDVHIICFNTHKDVSIVSCVSGDYKFCRKPNSIFKTQSSVVFFFHFSVGNFYNLWTNKKRQNQIKWFVFNISVRTWSNETLEIFYYQFFFCNLFFQWQNYCFDLIVFSFPPL